MHSTSSMPWLVAAKASAPAQHLHRSTAHQTRARQAVRVSPVPAKPRLSRLSPRGLCPVPHEPQPRVTLKALSHGQPAPESTTCRQRRVHQKDAMAREVPSRWAIPLSKRQQATVTRSTQPLRKGIAGLRRLQHQPTSNSKTNRHHNNTQEQSPRAW